jgi:hypothetical protein
MGSRRKEWTFVVRKETQDSLEQRKQERNNKQNQPAAAPEREGNKKMDGPNRPSV